MAQSEARLSQLLQVGKARCTAGGGGGSPVCSRSPRMLSALAGDAHKGFP